MNETEERCKQNKQHEHVWLKGWMDKWITPTTIVVILGGFVWGIQLDYVVITHTAELQKVEARQDEIVKINALQNESLVRVLALLESLERRVDVNEKHIDQNKRE